MASFRAARSYVLMGLSALLGGGSLIGLAAFLYLGSFQIVSLGLPPRQALGLDGALCLLFFLQHSGMLRRACRVRLARLIPEHAHPAVYSATSGAALLVLLVLWQRSDTIVVRADGPVRWATHGAFLLAGLSFGLAVRALRTFDPFGFRPLRAHARGGSTRGLPLTIRGPYRWVRHPLYALSVVLIWACPTFTLDRLLFSLLWTPWILLGTILEERDLVREFGQPYRDYQQRVPMLVPWRRPRK